MRRSNARELCFHSFTLFICPFGFDVVAVFVVSSSSTTSSSSFSYSCSIDGLLCVSPIRCMRCQKRNIRCVCIVCPDWPCVCGSDEKYIRTAVADSNIVDERRWLVCLIVCGSVIWACCFACSYGSSKNVKQQVS